MRRRTLIVLVLVAVFLLAGGTVVASARSRRWIAGEYVEAMAVRELDPIKHTASGWYYWRGRVKDPPGDWFTLVIAVDCVEFPVDEPSAAIFSGKVVEVKNWDKCWNEVLGQPCVRVGTYVREKVIDGRRPGGEGDQSGYYWSEDCVPLPFLLSNPCSTPVDDGMLFIGPIGKGDIVIHR
jgi:hypothetical protein